MVDRQGSNRVKGLVTDVDGTSITDGGGGSTPRPSRPSGRSSTAGVEVVLQAATPSVHGRTLQDGRVRRDHHRRERRRLPEGFSGTSVSPAIQKVCLRRSRSSPTIFPEKTSNWSSSVHSTGSPTWPSPGTSTPTRQERHQRPPHPGRVLDSGLQYLQALGGEQGTALRGARRRVRDPPVGDDGHLRL
jgi:hypothetical protein